MVSKKRLALPEGGDGDRRRHAKAFMLVALVCVLAPLQSALADTVGDRFTQNCLHVRSAGDRTHCEDSIANDTLNHSRDSQSRPCWLAGSDIMECRQLVRNAIEEYRRELNETSQRERMEAEHREAEERSAREAEQARAPRTQSVHAKGVAAVPGAIVCPDYQTVQVMFEWYMSHWSDSFEDVITKGQSRLQRGAPTPAPNLARFGCTLLAPGTPMTLELGNSVPVISAKLPDGTVVRGVTSPGMYEP